jgi:hypothetical protein
VKTNVLQHPRSRGASLGITSDLKQALKDLASIIGPSPLLDQMITTMESMHSNIQGHSFQ